jgi:hypothetical protein
VRLILKAKKRSRRLCLDFDGVLHRYSRGWTGDEPEEEPVDGALDFVRMAQGAGYDVVVHSRRPTEPIKRWLAKYGFPALDISELKPAALLYLDDRGMRFDGDFSAVSQYLQKNPTPGSWAEGHKEGRE